jgi:hypothetical protein
MDFQSQFCMSRESFTALVSFCQRHKLPDSAKFPHRYIEPLPIDEMVYITLWYLPNQCTHREISLLFNRSVSTVWRSINQINKIIELQLQHFIKWPTGEDLIALKMNSNILPDSLVLLKQWTVLT